MSYAQVAQHHKDNQSKAGKQAPTTPTAVAASTTTPQSDKAVETAAAAAIGQSQKGGGVISGAAPRTSQASQQADRDSSVRDNRGKFIINVVFMY